MLDIAAQCCELRDRRIALRGHLDCELLEIYRQLPPLRPAEESGEVAGVLRQQLGDPGEAVRVRFLDALTDEARRHVHAVEDIADVVQHVGRHFRHAGLARSDQQLPVHALELLLGLPPLGNILHDHDGAERLAGRPHQTPRAGQYRAHGAIGAHDDVLRVAHLAAGHGARQRTLFAWHRGAAAGRNTSEVIG